MIPFFPVVRPHRLAICLASVALVSSVGAQSKTCNGTWSAPFALQDSGGRPAFVEPGMGYWSAGHVIALGAPVYQWLEKDRPLDLEKFKTHPDTVAAMRAVGQGGLVIDSHGVVTTVPRPTLDGGWKDPVLFPRRDGSADVVYGVQTGDTSGTVISRIEYARFDGLQWTAPELLAKGDFRWHWSWHTSLAGRGDSLLVVASSRTDTADRLKVLGRIDGRWLSSAIPRAFQTYATGTAAVFNRAGRPVVVFNGDTAGIYASDGLFVTSTARWDDSGARWVRPFRFDSAALTVSQSLNLHRLGGDSLLLIWERDRTDASRPRTESIASAVSVDGGATWRMTDSLLEANGGPRTAMDMSGRVHLAYSASSMPGVLGSPGTVLHRIWRDGHWSEAVDVSHGETQTAPTLIATPTGMFAIWSNMIMIVVDGQPGVMPKSMGASWVPVCR
jgi:hypothetical protein